jgi:hypothetical protein
MSATVDFICRQLIEFSCRACKPNFVPAHSPREPGTRAREDNGRGTVIPLGRALLRGSSDLPGSCDAPSRHVPAVLSIQQAQNRRSPRTLLELPARESRWPAWSERTAESSPIWSCSVWGLPCHRHYWRRGALLPHLFTLTSPNHRNALLPLEGRGFSHADFRSPIRLSPMR